jgi:hypothetical protein
MPEGKHSKSTPHWLVVKISPEMLVVQIQTRDGSTRSEFKTRFRCIYFVQIAMFFSEAEMKGESIGTKVSVSPISNKSP